jgi:hypothetical protein
MLDRKLQEQGKLNGNTEGAAFKTIESNEMAKKALNNEKEKVGSYFDLILYTC